jgi:hypothetical protein
VKRIIAISGLTSLLHAVYDPNLRPNPTDSLAEIGNEIFWRRRKELERGRPIPMPTGKWDMMLCGAHHFEKQSIVKTALLTFLKDPHATPHENSFVQNKIITRMRSIFSNGSWFKHRVRNRNSQVARDLENQTV